MTAGALLSFALLAAAEAGPTARIETLDVRLLTGEVVRIDSNSLTVRTGEGEKTLPVTQLAEVNIAPAADAWKARGRRALLTRAGDRLLLADATFTGAELKLDCPLLDSPSVALSAAEALYLPAADQAPADLDALVASLKLAPASGDRVIVAREGARPLAVDGVLEAVGPEKITFRWKGASRSLPRENVRLIRLAAVAGIRGAKPAGRLVAADGSTLGFSRLTMADGTVRLVSPVLGECRLAWSDVAAVRYTSGGAVSLSQVKPEAVREQGFFETTFRHRVDRAVSGRPLRLGGRTYATGLGLHSACELLYRLEGQYAALVAVVGIDDAVRPHGDATLHFVGDGRALIEPVRLTGRDEPRRIRVDLAGVRSLLVRVDFGSDGLGVADHVDLAAARLLKKAPSPPAR